MTSTSAKSKSEIIDLDWLGKVSKESNSLFRSSKLELIPSCFRIKKKIPKIEPIRIHLINEIIKFFNIRNLKKKSLSEHFRSRKSCCVCQSWPY